MYLDANFFIHARFGKGEKNEKALSIMKDIREGKAAITSSPTIDEVMWVIIKNIDSKKLRETIEDIYKTKNLSVKETPRTIPLKALDFIEGKKFKPRDAIHVAVMKHFKEKEIVSDDSDFDSIPGIKRLPLVQ